MTSIAKLKEKWMKEPKVRKAYEEMEPEFQAARALIAERMEVDLDEEPEQDAD